MDSQQPTSEGVRRVLQAASQRACHCGADVWTSGHLVWELWQDESRAHEILRQAGVTAESLTAFVGEGVGSVENEHASPQEVDPSSTVQVALRVAQSLAGHLGRHEELGTEHLLMGLIECDSELADWLAGQGITVETLRREMAAAQGWSEEPIAVDIALTPTIRTGRETVRVDRILDAAANRCREGLRVVEDFVRFAWDDTNLSQLLKEHRHELAAALDLLPADRMLAARDTTGDVGTGLQTSAEQHREHAHDVVRANCKRVEESLRTLEEYSKTVNPDAAARFESLRYRFYTIEQAVIGAFRPRKRLAQTRLYLLFGSIPDALSIRDARNLIRAALRGGVDIVQLREKEMSDARLLNLARSVRQWTAEAGALLIVNDRPDIAALCEADGVHLGQEDLSVSKARQILGGDKLIGVSTHSIEQARQAVLDGADYLGVGPVFPSHTKEFANFPGLALVKEVAAEITRPWFPLGGINPSNVADVFSAGATRVAVSEAIASADDPYEVASQLRRLSGMSV